MTASLPDLSQVQPYFNAWNTHDPEAVAAILAPGGTYSDPTVTGPPLSGAALAEHARVLLDGLPDLSFELLSAQPVDADLDGGSVVVRWLMRGTNTGPLLGWPPSGRSVALRGVDVITVAGGQMVSVESYFDRQTLAEQLGLQVIVQPDTYGPWQLGYAYSMTAGRAMDPGAIGVTWIDVRSPDEAEQIEALGDLVAAELIKAPGFISMLGAGVGNRLYTVTAWESADTARQTMRMSTHASAMKHVFSEGLGEAVGTGVWAVHHLNPLWVRCTSCARLTDRTQANGTCTCGQPLPASPPHHW
jgi:steroid delta-isomerase-like uncharacterized protein